MTTKALKKQLMAAIAMVLVAAIALTSATYAWFVNNARVTATNVNVTASTAYSLLISKNKTTWGTTTELNSTAVNLIPASTTGTKYEADDTAETKKYNKGDLRFATDTIWTGNYVTGYKEVFKGDSVTTKNTSNLDVTSKYFYKDTVYLKSAQAAKIYLDANGTGIGNTVTEGINTATNAFNFSGLTDKQKAMLNTMRVAFVVTNTTQTTSNPATYVYQLVEDGSGDTHYSTTNNETGANGITAGVKVSDDAIETATYDNFVTNTVPVITDKMAVGSNKGFATTTTAESLATVEANDVVQVDIYVWMEGCDYDVNATNLVSFQEAAINAMMYGFCIGSAS